MGFPLMLINPPGLRRLKPWHQRRASARPPAAAGHGAYRPAWARPPAAAGRGAYRPAWAWTAFQERMNSPLDQHEVRLRGLRPRLRRVPIKTGASAGGARAARFGQSGAAAIQERMNSPLDQHEVRLRGLRPRASVRSDRKRRIRRWRQGGAFRTVRRGRHPGANEFAAGPARSPPSRTVAAASVHRARVPARRTSLRSRRVQRSGGPSPHRSRRAALTRPPQSAQADFAPLLPRLQSPQHPTPSDPPSPYRAIHPPSTTRTWPFT
jgi:hypothetical protein